jgi:hypothetical protein
LLVAYGLQAGDAELWEELIATLHPIFTRAIYRIAATWGTVISDEIDDVMQETFLKLGAGRQDTILRANLLGRHRIPEQSDSALPFAAGGERERDAIVLQSRHSIRKEIRLLPRDRGLEAVFGPRSARYLVGRSARPDGRIGAQDGRRAA